MSSVLPELPRLARYGLSAMIQIAEGGGERLSSAKLAESTGAPKAMLAKVLGGLASAGLLDGVKGHHGGYRLAKPASSILLADIVAAATNTDEPRRVACVLGNWQCDASNPCALHDQWVSVVDEAAHLLFGATLESLIAPQ